MGFISVSLRAILNLESLSGVETVGTLSRHRTAPVVFQHEGGYVIRFVPVLSGESIARSFQELLLEEAGARSLPIGVYSRRREFLKFTDENLMAEEGLEPPKDENDVRRAEVDILLKDYVADVGGFLYAGKKGSPIKRTSCFQVGYAIPAIEEKEAAALESQFHVRFAPSKPEVQIPYNVEVGSALYTFTFNLDTSRVGIPSTAFGSASNKEEQLETSRPERVKGALSALLKFYSYIPFGAKRSRFLPNMELRSAVASYSNNSRFVVSPGNDRDYIRSSVKRRADFVNFATTLGFSPQVELFAFDKEKTSEGLANVMVHDTIEGMIGKITEKASKS